MFTILYVHYSKDKDYCQNDPWNVSLLQHMTILLTQPTYIPVEVFDCSIRAHQSCFLLIYHYYFTFHCNRTSSELKIWRTEDFWNTDNSEGINYAV